MSTSGAQHAETTRRRRLLEGAQRSLTKAPLVWAGCGIALAVILLIIAVTGGFGDAPARAQETPQLSAGDEHRNDRFAVTIVSAAFAQPEEGEEEGVLEVELTMANLSGVAFSAMDALRETLVVPGVTEDSYATVVRSDDGSRLPWVQPGIPVPMTVSWDVPVEALAAAPTLRIDLLDPHLYVLSELGTGSSWVDPVLGAQVEVDLEEVPR